MEKNVYYRHSGVVPIAGLIVALVAAAPLALLSGVLYALLILIPIVGTVSFFFSVGFGGLVGLGMGWLVKRGRIRNNAIAVAVTLAAAVLASYVSWALWLSFKFEDVGFLELVRSPKMVWAAMKAINAVGGWSNQGPHAHGRLPVDLWASKPSSSSASPSSSPSSPSRIPSASAAIVSPTRTRAWCCSPPAAPTSCA